MDFILLALLLAMGVVAARAITRGLKKRRYAQLRAATPGYSPDHPALLSSAQAMAEVVEAARCHCGGRIDRNFGETSRMGLRVVRGRCVECEDDVELYFVLPKLLN